MVFLTNSRCFKYQTTYLYVQKAITSKDITVMVVFRPENSSLRSRQLFPRSRWSRSRNRSRQIIFGVGVGKFSADSATLISSVFQGYINFSLPAPFGGGKYCTLWDAGESIVPQIIGATQKFPWYPRKFPLKITRGSWKFFEKKLPENTKNNKIRFWSPISYCQKALF